MAAHTSERDRLLKPIEVSHDLGVPVATLARWRYFGTGPRWIKVGRHVRYRGRDLDAWIDAHASNRD
jgi:predicted DNA-binding transcriptional regulator AlpA